MDWIGVSIGTTLRHGLMIGVVVCVNACSSPTNTLPAGSTVLALGDSLTYGTGATPETSYPAYLQVTTRWKIINAGVPGDTAENGCARLKPLLEESRPALVLVFLGGNDFLRRRPDAALTTGLSVCVRDAKAAGIPLVLFAVPKFGLTGFSDDTFFESFAKSSGVAWLSPGLGKLLRDESTRADPVHLNADGYRKMAANVAAELRRLGYFGR